MNMRMMSMRRKPSSSQRKATKRIKITWSETTDERLQKRAERFGLPPSSASKKAARAARFGLPEASVPSKGTSAVSKTNIEQEERMKKRKERFGIVTTAASVGPYDSDVQCLSIKNENDQNSGLVS